VRYVFNLCYLGLALCILPWLIYVSLTTGKYRQGWWVKLTGRVPPRDSSAPCAWLHAVSVGEVNLLAPFLDQFRERFPTWELVITTTTRTGWELAQRRYADQARVYYCPLDFSWGVEQMLRRVRPELLVLAELELWPNLIAGARRRGVKVAIINGRLSDSSFQGYRKIRWLLRSTLRKIDLIAVQNDQYARRFLALGASPKVVHVTGSIKFDGASGDRTNRATRRMARLGGVAPDEIVFLAGSTQAPEEQLVLDVFRQLSASFPQLRLIITPRHAERFAEVARLLDDSGIAWQRRTDLVEPEDREGVVSGDPAESGAEREDDVELGRSLAELHQEGLSAKPPRRPVLLVNTIGELRAWWGVSHIAFVGGSLGSRGGQNMIEPAGFGAAVCFGPNTRNFRDVVQLLLEAGGAEVVRSAEELRAFLHRCLEQPEYRSNLGLRAQRVVAAQQGATRRTLQHIEALLQR
jgi:3-deoxy-D-manno-octulosonic-acid transferase